MVSKKNFTVQFLSSKTFVKFLIYLEKQLSALTLEKQLLELFFFFLKGGEAS